MPPTPDITLPAPSVDDLNLVELRRYLTERDVPCPSCRYSLKGLTSDRCPECNQQITLGVQLVEPKLAAYIAVLIGLAGAIGFWTVGMGFMLYFIIVYGMGFGPGPAELTMAGTGLLLGFCTMGPWLWHGRRIRRQPRLTQIFIGMGLWMLMLLHGAGVIWYGYYYL